MDSIRPPSRPTGQDTGHGDSISTRPRANSERDLIRSSMSIHRPKENRSPANFPRACEGMLKTTTETGDIGMFSIKPSRVPQSLGTPRKRGTSFHRENGHQRPRQNFQPYGVPVVDDRRRLPSYARDAASEVISMYESASQKSASRVFDEPDYRSYSMTQTSYSSYTLSNHRSYNSLRSQAEANPRVQRPRSPFAYPARLKRPGFRPSSPALTDGGVVDYSRRAEIERIPPGPVQNTSSPSSLYAHRRRPHQSLRPDANRSTPSLLSQPSPPRRCSSPLVSRSNGISSHDWARRPGLTSVNTSPARSTFSLASTVNFYACAQPSSTTTTPGKVPPPSPLYYDYTEDFEVETYNEPVTVDPPPPFRVEKTIPEDRPMSSERPVSKGHSSSNDISTLQSLPPESPVPFTFDQQEAASQNPLEVLKENLTIQSGLAKTDTPSQDEHGCMSRDRNSVRLSGLGYGALLLRSHVDEAFGNFPSSALDFTDPNKTESAEKSELQKSLTPGENIEKEMDLPSTRSSYSIMTSIPHFPSPPPTRDFSQSEHSTHSIAHRTTEGPLSKAIGSQDPSELDQPHQPSVSRQHQGISVNARDTGSNSGKTSSESTGSESVVSATAMTINATEADIGIDRQPSQQQISSTAPDALRRTPMTSPTVPEGFKLRKTDFDQCHILPMPLHSRRRGADDPQIQPLKCSQYYGSRQLDLSAISDQGVVNIPNFSHRNPKRDMPRSESPMLAPKPISPARQLKLKNSVPQLMKALPPLPPEPLNRPGSPKAQLGAEEVGLPCNFSRIGRGVGNNSDEGKQQIPANIQSPNPILGSDKDKEEQSEVLEVLTTCAIEEIGSRHGSSESSLPPPRMKLKVKSSGSSQRPTLPPDSRPWNLAENYPWSSQISIVRLPLVVPDHQVSVPNPPKFRLKVTRASNSTHGTVRVNRNVGDSKPLMHLRNPKDFFTPSTGIDNIFRQVSRHLHSRKASMASSHASQNDANLPASSISSPKSTNNPLTVDSTIPQLLSSTANPLNSSEARSVFSDDSSNVQGNHSLRLRGRLSNLRARIAVPYAMRTGSQSHDDITWRDRNGTNAARVPPAARSSPDLHGNRKSTETARPMRRWVARARQHKLKAKVHLQSWLKEAKSAVIRVRTRSTTGDGVESMRD
ncbi:hypothetical protein ONS95_007733 [Cadophora gregata]|uniref:uncharacterized protein n=1 Tax=Cadophora gregata TaxID=51156 RepID=UPI0026DD7373|nr:uncharacterized protein ONS95_007733 [Cadophora gregata]KAK0126114.1 hypothetical protein ONS95_007733 [Cadophora gregata]